jgi:hypothetical protein
MLLVEVSEMFHPAYAQALAKERHTDLIKAAERHRRVRAARLTGGRRTRRQR